MVIATHRVPGPPSRTEGRSKSRKRTAIPFGKARRCVGPTRARSCSAAYSRLDLALELDGMRFPPVATRLQPNEFADGRAESDAAGDVGRGGNGEVRGGGRRDLTEAVYQPEPASGR